MSNNTILKVGANRVEIDAGELVGYEVSGHEFMHQKGNPGWRSVDTEMFPIIGPTNEANFKVSTPRGEATQDQHGLLRELNYTLLETNNSKALYIKKYTANKEVLNSKYPDKSSAEKLSWPYGFEFSKAFELTEHGLEIVFTITGENGMPFMLGYHPAFMVHTKTAKIIANHGEIDIPEIMAVGDRALQIPNTSTIVLKDKREMEISTQGFGHFMLWTAVPNMVCIEPITFYPYGVAQQNLEAGFMELKNNPITFKVTLKPS